jgi:hypothetical protein
MLEDVFGILAVPIMIAGTIVTVRMVFIGDSQAWERQSSINKILIVLYMLFAFAIVCGYAGSILRHEQSWWIVTQVKRAYYRFGFWDAVFCAATYFVFYSALILIVYYGRKRLVTSHRKRVEWEVIQKAARRVLRRTIDSYIEMSYSDLVKMAPSEKEIHHRIEVALTYEPSAEIQIEVDEDLSGENPDGSIEVEGHIGVRGPESEHFYRSEVYVKRPDGEVVAGTVNENGRDITIRSRNAG